MTEESPLVSVIMPAYNAEKFIAESIESVIAQTYTNWELIVVDDCSTDGTASIADKYDKSNSRIHLRRNSENAGASQSRHNGIEYAEGTWLAFLDSDDVWKPEKLEKQLALADRSGADLIYTASAFMDSDGKHLDYILNVPGTLDFKTICRQNLLSNSSSLVKKELFMKHEVVKDNIHEDFACWLSIMKTGLIAYGLNEPLLVYRVSTTSKSGNKLKAAVMNWNTYRAVGMGLLESAYNMCWYTVKGILKYKKLRT